MKKLVSIILTLIICFSVLSVIPVYAEGEATNITSLSEGDVIAFGTYPQNKVDSELIIAQLNKLITSSEKSSGVVADKTYNGTRYKCVAKNGTYSWYAYAPVRWRVLDPATGYVVSEKVLDKQKFYKNDQNRVLDGETIYPNNYLHSDIRTWLNNDFFNTAFTDSEKAYIVPADRENKGFVLGDTHYDYANTNDKITLLSYQDTQKYEYAKYADGTDYTNSDAYWWLRSAGYATDMACIVNNSGTDYIGMGTSSGLPTANYFDYVNMTNGIRPAMCIDIGADISPLTKNCLDHSFTKYVSDGNATCQYDGTKTAVCNNCGAKDIKTDIGTKKNHTEVIAKEAVAPTCQNEGKTCESHCSVCGEIISTAQNIPATGHIDSDKNMRCDNCGAKMGILAFFQRIIDFFKSLFGIK